MEQNNKLNPVFLLSVGRSGSTLLQRHLNCSDDLILWGEHGGFLRGLSKTYYQHINHLHTQNLLRWGHKNADVLLSKSNLVNQDIEWTNNFTLADWKTTHRDLILRLFTKDVPPTLRWGFKEIRYGKNEIHFLRELFPESRLIFLLRNPIDSLASMVAAWYQPANFWEKDDWMNTDVMSNLQNFISQHCSRMIMVAKGLIKYMDDAYMVKYEDLTANPRKVIPAICEYLNIKAPSDELLLSTSSDVRKATNSKVVKKIISDIILEKDDVQGLCGLFEEFDYSC